MHWPPLDVALVLLTVLAFIAGVWSAAMNKPRHIAYAGLGVIVAALVVLMAHPALTA